ncbi:MAG TPA: ATP synthase F0 subunit B [Candidatus Paceibacterota bacterium]
MQELFSQLGINAGALIAQSVNFLIVLVVLTIFVYKPLRKVVDARRGTIEKGLTDAHDAKLKLELIGEKEQAVLDQAERMSLEIVKEAEGKAEFEAKRIIDQSEVRAGGIIKEAKTLSLRQAAEERANLEREATKFVREVVKKTVELDPKLIDERLIEEAVNQLRKARA